MTEKRNITEEDVLLKIRIPDAGVEVKKPPTTAAVPWGPRLILDGTDIVLRRLTMLPNPQAPLQIVIDGNDATISDMGKVVATGKMEEPPTWCDMLMSDGTTRVGDVFPSNMPTECYLLLGGGGCFAYDTGRTCRYCGFYVEAARGMPSPPPTGARPSQERAIEAVALAAKNGWRGCIQIVGGLLPPKLRGEWFTDTVEMIMTQFREFLGDDDILAELQIAVDNAPPNDLGEFHKWKGFGISSIEIDTEVLDPDWFKAICPAKSKRLWDEGQEAAAEVFGRGRGSSNLFVLGLEPMAGMLEGVEERVSKGVYVMPSPFTAHPYAPMAGMGAPSLEWFREAYEKIIDIYLKYGDTFDIPLTDDDRWGYTRRGRSLYAWDDDMTRRLQEMGKLPPGLPSQYGIEPVSWV
ncbi:MAG: radical SAM protein [Desulfobacterales bacterium]